MSGWDRALLIVAALTTIGAVLHLLRPPTLRYPGPTRALMASLAQDGDRALDAAEFDPRAPPQTPLPLVDRDGDGRVDEAELEALLLAVDPSWLVTRPH